MAQRQIPLATKATRLDYLREDIDLWSWGDLSAKEMATLTVRALRGRFCSRYFFGGFLTTFLSMAGGFNAGLIAVLFPCKNLSSSAQ